MFENKDLCAWMEDAVHDVLEANGYVKEDDD